jgi:hypothetical protein
LYIRASPYNISVGTPDGRNVRSGIMVVSSTAKINHMVQNLAEGRDTGTDEYRDISVPLP